MRALIRAATKRSRTLSDFRALRQLRMDSASFANSTGWLRSHRKGAAVDADGLPLPWITYASLSFIEARVNSSMDVFEFGSGQSTLWFEKRVRSVTSVEHDTGWYEAMRSRVGTNVSYSLHSVESGEYAKAILSTDSQYHMVVIDGRDRVACAESAVNRLHADGVIIWDNSEREAYADALAALGSQGFRRLDFVGAGPVGVRPWATSVLYRAENCLGI